MAPRQHLKRQALTHSTGGSPPSSPRQVAFVRSKSETAKTEPATSSAKRHAELTSDDQELIPARMINEFAYCPRLFYLEYVQKEWQDNEDTLRGSITHSRVDTEKGKVLPPNDLADGSEPIVARSVLMSAPELGAIARMDILETTDDGVRPVDYKKGSPSREGPWEPDKIQLCLQGLILRENGYRCSEGVLYYAETKQRISVDFDKTLVDTTLEALSDARSTASETVPPPPLVDSPKCPRCSLVGICLPDETSILGGRSLESIRRLMPARDDACPVYVQEQGATVGISKGRLILRSRISDDVTLRLIDVSQVCLLGNVQISAQALRALAEREIVIFHFTYGGWLTAVTSGIAHRNVELRSKQYRIADSEETSLPLALEFVVGKLKNQRTLLRRNHPHEVEPALDELQRLARLARKARSISRLFGLEGSGARTYFSHFSQMLKGEMQFEMSGRHRRPPTDPVNALLSFIYSLLVKDGVQALLAVGLDPYRGMFHQLRYGRPSLALDLIEEFRPLIADSTVLRLINNRIVTLDDFICRGSAYAINDRARKKVIAAYEARMDTLIRHPLFHYKVSYRRVMEIQARLLARAIEGDIEHYRAFVTR